MSNDIIKFSSLSNKRENEVLPLFPTPFLITDLSDKIDEEEIKKLQDHQNDKPNIISNDMNLMHNNFYILNTVLKDSGLSSLLQEKVDEFLLNILGESAKLKITQSWLNFTPKGSAHHKHRHSNSIVSGVFYVNTTPQTGHFVIEKPDFYFSQLSNMATYSTMFTQNQVQISPKNYELFLFPSWLNHYVQFNESDETRISLSFNTFYTGIIKNDLFPDNMSLTRLAL